MGYAGDQAAYVPGSAPVSLEPGSGDKRHRFLKNKKAAQDVAQHNPHHHHQRQMSNPLMGEAPMSTSSHNRGVLATAPCSSDAAGYSAAQLSLIHISEPTRPY